MYLLTDMIHHEEFLGMYNGFDEPQAVSKARRTIPLPTVWQPCASHQINVSLAPGEKVIYLYSRFCELAVQDKWKHRMSSTRSLLRL